MRDRALKPLVLRKETLKDFIGGSTQFGTFSGQCSSEVCTLGCPDTFVTTTACGNCTTGCNPTQ